MKQLLIVLLLLPLGVFAQRYKEQINSYGSGDQQISLGKYRIGSVIRIESQISGPYAEDGGIYHIAGDWAGVRKVIYRGRVQYQLD